MVFDCIIYILMIIPSLIFSLTLKLRNKKIWLISENGLTASDNGYYLFKHIRSEHPDIKAYYVINKSSRDYKRVKN